MAGLNPSIMPWMATSGITALATATSTAIVAAGATNVRHFVTDVEIVNTSATVSTLISILDGATVIWTGYFPAITAALPVSPMICQFSTPLSGTAATALNIKANTTGANIYWNVQGFDC